MWVTCQRLRRGWAKSSRESPPESGAGRLDRRRRCSSLVKPPFATSKFEYGVYRDYSGVIEEWPYPILRTDNSSFLLVAPGKHGLSDTGQGTAGQECSLEGHRSSNGDQDRMLEVVPASIARQAPQSIAGGLQRIIDLGPVTLRGEIVDSKCYLGVMNPGNGKVHRDCAVRCISGGAPPAFIARDASGEAGFSFWSARMAARSAGKSCLLWPSLWRFRANWFALGPL